MSTPWQKRFAVVGTRAQYKDESRTELKASSLTLKRVCEEFIRRIGHDVTIISGGASGVDSWAVDYAQMRGLQTEVYPAEWKKYGKGAGFKRNKDLVRLAHSVIAFWDGESKGTEHTIKLVEESGKPYTVFLLDKMLCFREHTDGPTVYLDGEGNVAEIKQLTLPPPPKMAVPAEHAVLKTRRSR